jgi:hypothetical protein
MLLGEEMADIGKGVSGALFRKPAPAGYEEAPLLLNQTTRHWHSYRPELKLRSTVVRFRVDHVLSVGESLNVLLLPSLHATALQFC